MNCNATDTASHKKTYNLLRLSGDAINQFQVHTPQLTETSYQQIKIFLKQIV